MKNTLFLECRGCYFFNNDKINTLSDVGNYRVGSYDNSIILKDGRKFIVEFSSYTRREMRYNHKRTGKPLKHPKYEIVLENALHIDTQYDEGKLSFRDLTIEKEIHNKKLTYTKENILKVVNELSVHQYDNIVLVSDYKIVSKIETIYKMGGFRERAIIDDLVEIKTVERNKNYLVLRFISDNGNTFDYEYNTNRIVG